MSQNDHEVQEIAGWAVDNNGYRWTRREHSQFLSVGRTTIPAGRSMVLLRKPGKWDIRGYQPLAVPNLFRKFAETKTDPESMLAFANEFGELGIGVRIESDEPSEDTGTAELLEAWQLEIGYMKAAVDAWDACERGDEDSLRQHVKRSKEMTKSQRNQATGYEWVYFEPDGEGGLRVGHLLSDKHGRKMSRFDAARMAIAEEANEHFQSFCPVRLVRMGRTSHNYKIVPAPNCLLGCMWWQLARLVAGMASYRSCKVCGKPIEISTEEHGSRKSREYCSESCKVKDYRNRVKQAKAMHGEGKTVSQIARHLGTDKLIIQKWLVKKK